jgi:hypothetical protein
VNLQLVIEFNYITEDVVLVALFKGIGRRIIKLLEGFWRSILEQLPGKEWLFMLKWYELNE